MNNEFDNPTQQPQPTRRRYTRALSLGSSLNSNNSSEQKRNLNNNVLGIHFSPQVENVNNDNNDQNVDSVSNRRSISPMKSKPDGPRPPSTSSGLRVSRDVESQSVNSNISNGRSCSPSKVVRIISPQSEALLSFHEQNPHKHQEHIQKRQEFEKAEAKVMEREVSNETNVDFNQVNLKLEHMNISTTGTPQLDHSPKHPLRVTNPSASTTSLDYHENNNSNDNENGNENDNIEHNEEKEEKSLPPRTSSRNAISQNDNQSDSQSEIIKEDHNDNVDSSSRNDDQIPVRKRSQTLPQNPRSLPKAPNMEISKTELPKQQSRSFSASAQQMQQSQSQPQPSSSQNVKTQPAPSEKQKEFHRNNTSSTKSQENQSMLKNAHLDFLSKPPSSTEFPYAAKVQMRSGSNFSLNASSIGSNGVDIRSSRGMKGLAHAERGGGAVKFDLHKGGFVTPSNSSCSTSGAIDPPKLENIQKLKNLNKSKSQPDLLRHSTLLNTKGPPARTARELRAVLSGSSGSRMGSGSQHPINLEQSRTKSRAEVDLVLDSEAVVEGGVLGGRMDVKLSSDKVWWGNGKVRVVGFEDLQNTETRHVFFHHDTPVDFYPPPGYGLPDDEGYYRGKVGKKFTRRYDDRISLPFKIKLPIGGGAKGPLKSKLGLVRYIVIGLVLIYKKLWNLTNFFENLYRSIHLKSSDSNDRSIAHFYRYVTIYPLLSPSSVLAPAPMPLLQTASKPLFLGGKGPINLTASVHRPHWVAGQRLYVMITIDNQSSKRVSFFFK